MRKTVLFFIFLVSTFLLAGCSARSSFSIPKAEDGVIDLTHIQLERNVVRLDGEWEFYRNQLLEPGKLKTGAMTGYINNPGSWNKYIADTKGFSEGGYATYKLTFISGTNERLALKLPKLRTAYKLWVNGGLCASAGIVGKTRDSTKPQYLPAIAFFESRQGQNELVIQVSNFYERTGGITESIKIGGEEQILGLRYRSIAQELFIFGALMIMGAYHLALYVLRRKNPSSLYFGSFCLLVAARTLLVGECFIIYLFPGFNWEIAHKLQTLVFYLGTPFIILFFKSVFTDYFHIRIVRASQLVGLAFALLVIFTPARIFTVVNPLYQLWAGFMIVYIAYILIKIAVCREKDSHLIIVGALALLLTAMGDIIFDNIWITDNSSLSLKAFLNSDELSSVGQLLFAAANALLLAKRFSEAMEKEEVMIAQLKEINANLDEQVFQRTKALEDSYEKIELQKLELEKTNRNLEQLSLKDSLTGLWNRRKYDETIGLEWQRCLRYGRPISLLLLDVDFYKMFNDFYGHTAGDECLVILGETIKNSFSRPTDMAIRYGGEEFVVLLSEAGKDDAIRAANMLKQKIEALHIPHRKSTISDHVTVSIGVAYTVPHIDTSYDMLFNTADKAMYQAKSAGRDCVMSLPL